MRGFTLTELLMVVAVASLVLTATAAYTIPGLFGEPPGMAAYSVQTYAQLARMEAINRKRDCRLVVNRREQAIRLAVYDTASSSTSNDPIYEKELPDSVELDRPYEGLFAPDGTLAGGSAHVAVSREGEMHRIVLYEAGGTEVHRWNGSAWVPAP